MKKLRPGAYALDCHGSILHRDPDILGWGRPLVRMTRDIELQMCGMIEVMVIGPRHTTYFPRDMWNPYYLYKDWN